MKPLVNSIMEINQWLACPEAAIFKGQDLRAHSQKMSLMDLGGCVFLGCQMEADLTLAAANAQCLVVPTRTGLPFNPFSPGLYTPNELYDKYDLAAIDPLLTYHQCLDWRIYDSVFDPMTKLERPVDVDVLLMRRIHDSSLTDSLNELLEEKHRYKCVAIMGGHDRGRNELTYERTAKLALQLTQANYFVVTGGGPGLMEAANLGAYSAGFDDPESALELAIEQLALAPRYDHPEWLRIGFQTWKKLGKPINTDKSRSLGIPTWFYGHEPPNVFATDIAKYFENSVREEGLLAISQAGIIFAEGNSGTVQEIFQDANQNYYRTYGRCKSPMILFNTDYWNPANVNFNNPADKRKPVYTLLHKLATEKKFDDYLLLSDDLDTIVKFIQEHPPIG